MHNDLWRYACERYAQPGVEAACMAVQAAGGNVCLALCALWLEDRGVRWSLARAQALETAALPWAGTVIEPLRALRQQWRSAAREDPDLARLRARIKQLELEAEQRLLMRLHTIAQAWPEGEATQPEWLGWAVEDAAIRAALRAAASP
jgi:uncharacterized protein (TIGR02444 family)